MGSILFLIAIVAFSWVVYWSVMNERHVNKAKTGIFGLRDPEEYHKQYGDRQPF